MKEKIHVSLEGNIGCGKSTVFSSLKKYTQVPVLLENVNNWKYLKKYYECPQLYAYPLQKEILLDLQKRFKGYQKVISERCAKTSVQVFAALNVEAGNISQDQLQLLISMELQIPGPTHYIYLELKPKLLVERIRKRARESESAITLEYLEQVHEKQEIFLSTVTKPVYRIDASHTEEEVLQETLNILASILKKTMEKR